MERTARKRSTSERKKQKSSHQRKSSQARGPSQIVSSPASPKPIPQVSMVSPFAAASIIPEPKQQTGVASSLDIASPSSKPRKKLSMLPSWHIASSILKAKQKLYAMSPFSIASPMSTRTIETDRDAPTTSATLPHLPEETGKKDAFGEWYEAAHRGTVTRTIDTSNRMQHSEKSIGSIGVKRGLALGIGTCFTLLLFLLLVGVAYLYPADDNPARNATSARACGTVRLHQLEVLTASGLVTGRPATVVDAADNNSVHGVLRHFFGVPYGEPPTGPHRFGMPKAVSYFNPNGTWDADAHGPRCPQSGPLLASSDEDCLRLSIWAPYVCNDSDPLKTVVVAVAGDWMQTGDVRDHERFWQRLALHGDFIVAVINHRQGVLGFFAGVGDRSAPGNVAIYDTHLAVVWMHNNAAVFHGDGNAMVALGRGSGGFMFSSLLFTNSDRYLKRLILHGLSVTSLFPRNEETAPSLLGAAMNCPKDLRLSEIAACLRGKDFRNIVSAAQTLLPLRFVPSRYRAPLSNELYSAEGPKPQGDLKGIDIICGTSMSEGETLFDDYVAPGMNISGTMNVDEAFHGCLAFFSETYHLEYRNLPEALKTFLKQPHLRGFREIIRDIAMTCPMRSVAEAAAASGATVHHYVSTGAQQFFEPVLTLDDIVLFATTGKVTDTWTPFNDREVTLVVNGSFRTKEEHWMTNTCKVYYTFFSS
ncbi:acetylcholinesterase-like isoform X1 [Dermacentor andersoni]|uniref:acetylcholinesterase-like isoform X1 n=1 Tax=Dermacentor andersoni TaxID=34620 RepID=UPI003B3A5CAB